MKSEINIDQLNVLLVTASAQQQGSVTRRFATEMIEQLKTQHGELNIITRDVSQGLPFIDDEWVSANFTPADQRSDAQRTKLAQSDALVQEVNDADIVVIAAPIYNFSIPASLKAWIDLIARAGLSFRYTPEGPVGLLQDGPHGRKKAYVVIASGGTRIGSEIDFASGYLRHVLGFIGIEEVSFISAERFNHEDQATIANIQSQIAQLALVAA